MLSWILAPAAANAIAADPVCSVSISALYSEALNMREKKVAKRPRSDANRCFVCGPDNPNGLQIHFRMDGELCRAQYTPTPDQCGYDDVVHGGILFSLLDDVMANCLFLQGMRAYTAKCEIRFRAPAQTGERLLLEGELLNRSGRRAKLVGRARRAADNKVVAETEGTFIIVPDPD